MVEKVKAETKKAMDKSIEALVRDLGKIRTGKAQTTMLDGIKVNYYGQPTPLNQVAALTCPDAKSFLITPWEVSVLKEIEVSIVNSGVGMTPMNDGKVIRLKVPDLTEDRRKDLVKQVKKLAEEAKVAVRMARRDANEALKKGAKDKVLSEDQVKKAETEIQKLTDDYSKKLETVAEQKEKELMTV